VRKAWAAYAALMTGAIVAGEIANVARGALDARTLANWFLTGVLLLATWGYALRRRIGAHRYWAPAFWVVLGATLVSTIPAAIAGTTLLLVVAPAFYAAYRYAYRSPDIWLAEEQPT
jgi:hypothetical protein